MLFHLVMRTNC